MPGITPDEHEPHSSLLVLRPRDTCSPTSHHVTIDNIKFTALSDTSSYFIHRPTAISHSPKLHALFSHDDPDKGIPEYKVDSHIGSVAVKLLTEWMTTQDISLPLREEVKRENEIKAINWPRPGGMNYITLANMERNPEYVTCGFEKAYGNPADTSDKQVATHCRYLCELWILAESLEMPKLQNQAIRKLEELYAKYDMTEEEMKRAEQGYYPKPFLHHLLQPYNLCKYVFDHTDEDDSWLRDWFIWWFAFEDRGNRINTYAKLYPTEMWVRMLDWLRLEAFNKGNSKRDVDDFMIHDWDAMVPAPY